MNSEQGTQNLEVKKTSLLFVRCSLFAIQIKEK